eukprot:ANDGO_07774.mRNA.1 putative serine/threonine-protein kinase nek3
MASKDSISSLPWAMKPLLHRKVPDAEHVQCDWIFHLEHASLWKFDRCLSLKDDISLPSSIRKRVEDDLCVFACISPNSFLYNRPALFGLFFSPPSSFDLHVMHEPVYGVSFDNLGNKFVVGYFEYDVTNDFPQNFGNLNRSENASLEFYFVEDVLHVYGLGVPETVVDETLKCVTPSDRQIFCLHHVEMGPNRWMHLWFRWGSRVLLCVSVERYEGQIEKMRYGLWTLDGEERQRLSSIGCEAVTWSSQNGFIIAPASHGDLRCTVSANCTDLRLYPDWRTVTQGLRLCMGSHTLVGNSQMMHSFTVCADSDDGEILLFDVSSFELIAQFSGHVREGCLSDACDAKQSWIKDGVMIEGRFVSETPSGIVKVKADGNVEFRTYRDGIIVEDEIVPLGERYASFFQTLRRLFTDDALFMQQNEDSLMVVVASGRPVCLFSVRNKIGSGTEGILYRGLSEIHGPTAVKVFRPSGVESVEKGSARRFFAEQVVQLDEETLFGLIPRNPTSQFPSLVRVFHVGTVDSGSYGRRVLQKQKALVMPYHPDGDVFRKVSKIHENLSSKMLFQQLKLLAQTVRALHASNLIHRDIKPRNVLLDIVNGHFVFRLTDFGISSVHAEAETYVDSGMDPHHQLGTPWWRPPEFVNEPALRTYRSDVFSLGWTMVYLSQMQQGTGSLTCEYLKNACQYFSGGDDLFSSKDSQDSSHLYNEMVDRDMQDIRDGRIAIHLATEVHSEGTSRILFSHLVKSMTAYNYTHRPRMRDVLQHPFFWDGKHCIQFIVDIVQPLTDLYSDIKVKSDLDFGRFECENHSLALHYLMQVNVDQRAIVAASAAPLLDGILNSISFEKVLISKSLHPYNNISAYKRRCRPNRMCMFFVLRFFRNLACHASPLSDIFFEELCVRYEKYALIYLLLSQCGKNGDLFGRIVEIASELFAILSGSEVHLSTVDRQVLSFLRYHGSTHPSVNKGLDAFRDD